MLNLNKLKTNNAKKCKITITSQLVDAGSAMASLPNAANIKKASIAFTTTIWPETFKNIVKYKFKFLLDQFLTTFEASSTSTKPIQKQSFSSGSDVSTGS